jgi:pYEATS domain-containing protein involved in immunity
MEPTVLASVLGVLNSFLWFIFLLILVILFRKNIAEVLYALNWRVKSGAQVKIASLELGATYVAPDTDISQGGGVIEARPDKQRKRYAERGNYYLPNRDIFMVHRLAPSKRPNQLYDILIYLVPHKAATLAGIQTVEYYFGPHWNDMTFTSTDRANGFSISTSAYGPFVCTAELHFTDGTTTTIWRYVDFEMGAVGKG